MDSLYEDEEWFGWMLETVRLEENVAELNV